MHNAPEMAYKISEGLRALGVEPDDTLLVHSSLKSLGWVDGGADTVIDGLIGSLPFGTLLLPALSYESVTKGCPNFSVKNTPCCVGTIPETFRKREGVVRSAHPTHSVCAAGVNAVKITGRHFLDRTPVGANSPFRLLPSYGGKILMLGCGLGPNTFMHGVEETVGTPYVLDDGPTLFYIEYEDGRIEEALHITHIFAGCKQRYYRAAGIVNVRRGKVLEADVYLYNSRELWGAASAAIEKDAFFFVDKMDD